MTPTTRRPHHQCPWFLSGAALGLLIGGLCIYAGLRTPTPHTPAPFATLPP